MRIFLIALCTLTIAVIACDPTSTPIRTPAQPAEPTPALLLTEDSAISILQSYLQECVLSWDIEYVVWFRGDELKMQRGRPLPSDQAQKWWMDLASGATGDIEWSAQFQGVTSAGKERWVVIGPGFRRAASELIVVPGRWTVFPAQRVPGALDAPAQLASEEYKKPLDPAFDRDCTGYSKSAGYANVEYFTKGSSMKDVLRIQGSPDAIETIGPDTWRRETWHYGRSEIRFSSERVSSWYDRSGNLKGLD